MTFAIFMALFLALFIAVLNIAPTAGTLPITISGSITAIIAYMKAWNFLFPISELFICVGIVVLFDIAIWSWKQLVRVVHIIRGTGTTI